MTNEVRLEKGEKHIRKQDTLVSYPITSAGVTLKISFYPHMMDANRYEQLAKEIREFRKRFWSTPCGSEDWLGVIDVSGDEYIGEFINAHEFFSHMNLLACTSCNRLVKRREVTGWCSDCEERAIAHSDGDEVMS